MSDQNQLSTNVKPRASLALSILTGMEPAMMLDTIKAQCFKGDPSRVTDTQLAAFVSIAAEMGVNPLLPGMMYAFPIQGGGIVPMMGPDAVFKKLAEHPNVDSWKTTVFPEDVTLAPTHATTEIFLRNSQRPLTYTALLSEWKVGANPNWNSRPRHMLSLRSLKQAARQVIHGVPFDEDERQMADMQNVTPASEAPDTPVTRPEPPKRSRKGAAAVQEAQVVTEVAAETPPAESAKVAEVAKVVSKTEQLGQKLADPVQEQAIAKTLPPEGKVFTESSTAATKDAPRAFLQDGEKLEAEITVQDIGALNITTSEGTKPSVKAKVTGGFVGEIYHIDGGVTVDGKAAIAPPWSKGAVLKAVLLGKLNNKVKNDAGGFGKVQVFVQSVEPAVAEEGMEA